MPLLCAPRTSRRRFLAVESRLARVRGVSRHRDAVVFVLGLYRSFKYELRCCDWCLHRMGSKFSENFYGIYYWTIYWRRNAIKFAKLSYSFCTSWHQTSRHLVSHRHQSGLLGPILSSRDSSDPRPGDYKTIGRLLLSWTSQPALCREKRPAIC